MLQLFHRRGCIIRFANKMIEIRLSKQEFEYDVYSLVKAFYQKEELHTVITCETGDDFSGFKVFYSEDEISVSRYENGAVLQEIVSEVPGLSVKEKKSVLKRMLYRLLSEATGRELPWGTLTGIRPTKIARQMLEEAHSKENCDSAKSADSKITQYMKEEYLCSDEKTALSIDIAKRELQILSKLHGTDGVSLYIGIPFCPTTCLYCSFTSYPIIKYKKLVRDYLDALKHEIDEVKPLIEGRYLDTVYIGGGTPTTLSPEQLEELLSYVREAFDFSCVCEFTVEAGRPDSITREKLETLKRMGVTRISINPQTMNDETLKIIGRRHDVAQVKEAFQLAREAGFTNINMDLILGLPGENLSMVLHTFEEIVALKPDNLTVHSMAIKRAAGMAQYLAEHEEIKSENTPEMMEAAANAAKKLSMVPYYLYRQKNMAGNFENVGYATKDCFGIYNILIMEEVQSIIALGAGTVTKRVFPDGRIERCDNVKDVALYIEKIDEMIERKRKLFSE